MKHKHGSNWNKWDLHFHTPSSYDYQDKSLSNSQIIDHLVINNVSGLAVTDHHVMDEVRIRELQVLGKEKGIVILPGIEFLADARGNDPIHFIAIFPETCDISFVWKQIESRTQIRDIQGRGKAHNEVYCDLFDTINIIKELGGIVTIHAASKSNSIENVTHALPQALAQKEDIAMAIDIFEVGKEADITEYGRTVIPFLQKKHGKHIPMVICSDNHKVTEYSVKQNLWLKADLTFEGLKQILYEPDHRVKVQREEPDLKDERLIIHSVRFICKDSKFSPQPIYLNKNLNVIIGGKSSGKSMLLYSIAKTLVSEKEFFVKERMEDKYKFRQDDPNFNFEITTQGGFKQLLYRDETENSLIPEIRYIPQNYLVDLAEPELNKKGEMLNKMVRDLIKEDPQSATEYDGFVSKLQSLDRTREGVIDTYFQLQEKVASLSVLLRSKPNSEVLQKNITTNTERVQELNKGAGLTDAQIEIYNDLQTKYDINKREQEKINNDFRKINDFNRDALESILSLNSKKELVSAAIENEVLKSLFDKHYTILGDVVKSISQLTTLFELDKDELGVNKFKIESDVSDLVSTTMDESKAIEVGLKPFLDNEEVKKQMEVLMKSIHDDTSAIHSISQLNKELFDAKNALQTEKDKLFQTLNETYSERARIIDALKNRISNLETDGLKISSLIKFNYPKFRNTLLEISDGRSASYSRYDIFNDHHEATSDFNRAIRFSELKEIFESIVEKEDYVLTRKGDRRTAVKKLLDDYFFDYWEIEYKGDKLGEMSTGKACFVILMLIVGLSKSKAPILIDQPEDNLDNRSITTDLVTYLRSKKLERQIIVVTHNPNIVVNADAENIIVANQKGQNDTETSSSYQFDYINGSLENTLPKNETETDLLKCMGIREHIAEIVEGGKEAFLKRERKYGFN